MRLIYDAPEHFRLNENGELIAGGSEFEVSAERAEELLTDPTIHVIEAPADDLTVLTRAELDDKARAAGLDGPEKLANKEAVIAALTTHESAAGDGEGHDDSQEGQA